MKHLKKFNESIKKKNIGEIIDEILDNLSSKKKLSNSEKEFMVAASKDEVMDATIPNSIGNYFQNMADPHNLGRKKVKDPNLHYKISLKLDYAIKSLYDIEYQFGYILPELKMDDDGNYSI